jgi:hypothetical protein
MAALFSKFPFTPELYGDKPEFRAWHRENAGEIRASGAKPAYFRAAAFTRDLAVRTIAAFIHRGQTRTHAHRQGSSDV